MGLFHRTRARIIFVVGLSACVLWPVSAKAIVDMRNANYSNTWIDFQLDQKPRKIELTRTYNSRTLFSGMFGFGWCSDWESKLTWRQLRGELILTHCGAGTEDHFILTPEDLVKLQEAKLTRDQLAGILATRPSALHGLRLTLVRASMGGIPAAFDLDEGGMYPSGPEWEDSAFDTHGRLKRYRGADISYDDKDRITRVEDKALNYTFDVIRPDALSMIITCSRLPDAPIKYTFDKNHDLRTVLNMWTNTYRYEYDNLHDLTLASFPDNTTIMLAYDTKHDWVTMFKDREDCVENYTYTSRDRLRYSSEVFKTCKGEIISHSVYNFVHEEREGRTWLSQVEILLSLPTPSRRTVFYDEEGRVIRIAQDDAAQTMELHNTRFFVDETKLLYEEPATYALEIQPNADTIRSVHVFVKGGTLETLKSLKDFYRQIDTAADPLKGFYLWRETFAVAEDADSLARRDEDGVAMKGAKLVGVKLHGKVYRLDYSPSGELLVQTAGLAKPVPSTQLSSEAYGTLAQDVIKALSYGSARQHAVADFGYTYK